MKRVLLRLVLAVMLVVIVVALTATMLLRASLPELEGELSASGLSAPAKIARDQNGIPVITAANRRDLAFATGYAHER